MLEVLGTHDYRPTIVSKKATRSQYRGLTHCELCKKFLADEQFRVVEEGGAYDNDWFAICNGCVAKPVYAEFIRNNCKTSNT